MPASRSAVAEYMKIRRHVLNLIAKAGNEPVRLPTALELSKQFGVCRQTVGKALKQLAEDRYVIGKPGLGTFTNPKVVFRLNSRRKARIIGMIIGDGMVIEMDEYLAKLAAACLIEASTYPAYVRTINLTSAKPDAIVKELRNESLDGLIWQNPPPHFLPLLEEVRESGTAVAVIGDFQSENISSVDFDLRSAGYECGKQLLKMNKKQLIFLRDEAPWNLSAGGLRQAFRKAGCPLNEKLFLKGEAILEKLKLIFELGVSVDAIVNPLLPYEDLAEIARLADFDLTRPFHICWDSIAKKIPDFHGFCYSYDFTVLAKETVALLRNQMEKTDPHVCHKLIPVQLKSCLQNSVN